MKKSIIKSLSGIILSTSLIISTPARSYSQENLNLPSSQVETTVDSTSTSSITSDILLYNQSNRYQRKNPDDDVNVTRTVLITLGVVWGGYYLGRNRLSQRVPRSYK